MNAKLIFLLSLLSLTLIACEGKNRSDVQLDNSAGSSQNSREGDRQMQSKSTSRTGGDQDTHGGVPQSTTSSTPTNTNTTTNTQ